MPCVLLSPKYPEKPIVKKKTQNKIQGILATSYFHQQKELMYQYYGDGLKPINAGSAIKRADGALC